MLSVSQAQLLGFKSAYPKYGKVIVDKALYLKYNLSLSSVNVCIHDQQVAEVKSAMEDLIALDYVDELNLGSCVQFHA
ncbi:hypothetical protein L2E82_39929 [Cichorium intybus]|uniref:Uncharacterized protein n=1 Tax=Cichorium intybus TaxID=13427 RepID=A0ACB9ANZ3_CICIN|nr:hypothetical protein L2E82_39929 [Cichorium intybus]